MNYNKLNVYFEMDKIINIDYLEENNVSNKNSKIRLIGTNNLIFLELSNPSLKIIPLVFE